METYHLSKDEIDVIQNGLAYLFNDATKQYHHFFISRDVYRTQYQKKQIKHYKSWCDRIYKLQERFKPE